ncbi:glutathione S-transferase [Pseudomonas auratipiscis]|uniref:Glutathione S-transferase n=1 Tax=Pseudomonas auratipiscis TaxID=3115853 RepID=A0AB35WSB8_9PSED|nr:MULTISPECIES: glutathione S-transferase [unclassified Pseudomonas]MEE1866292.1 glutathione S-transferase [Pseudomonas sp. 120P]MEE1957678.1 glutathione S-transferase [Pseudomonas sp. 119P]
MSAASMTLFHAPASPFVRKVMVVLHETGQIDRVTLQSVNLTPVNPVAELNQGNPAGKIPALRLADGSVLHDSRVICEYLDQQHVGIALIPKEGWSRWHRLTLASLADAIMDAAVLTRYETFLRPQEMRWDSWIEAQQEKIRRGLASLEQEHMAELSSAFDIAAIGVACALGYLDLRMPDFGWREQQPQLATWYAQVSQRASMLATDPSA